MKSKVCRSGALLLISVILLSLFVSCAPATEEPAPSAVAPSFPIEVTDQAGKTVSLEKIPEKIISLAPNITEILYALGLEDRLVGVTEHCDYPEAAKDKPKIGEFAVVDIEKVVEIQPDLILAANIHIGEVIPGLERLGLTVLTLDPKSIDDVLEAISLTGQLAGKKEEASRLVTGMRERIKAITDKTAALTEAQRPRVLYLVWHDPLMTVGAETIIHELIVKAGGINIRRDLSGDYPTISLEAVIMANPQVIIASSGHGTGENLPLEFAMTESRLEEVAARQTNRIYKIDSDLTSRPGPRLVDGLEELARIIHPEIFDLDQ